MPKKAIPLKKTTLAGCEGWTYTETMDHYSYTNPTVHKDSKYSSFSK